MAPLDPRIEASLRDGFRYLNRFMLLLWRLGIGPDALSDEALDSASHSYHLIHIQRTGGLAAGCADPSAGEKPSAHLCIRHN